MDDVASLTPAEISTMTPAEAGAALASMGTAPPPLVPQNAQDARAQLELLGRDPNFSRALFSGDGPARAQFERLVELKASGDPVADAIAGVVEPQQIFETTMDGQLPSSVVKQVVADMQAYNISAGAIKEGIDGTPVDAREYALTQALQTQKFGDADWVKRLMASDWAATREWKLMCNILSRPIAEPK
jgi:hypothetical protein